MVIIGTGIVILYAIPDFFQYIYPSPIVSSKADELFDLFETCEKKLKEVSEQNEIDAGTIAFRKDTIKLFGEGKREIQSTIYAVSSGFFDVKHETLVYGRLITVYDVNRLNNAIVIDQDAALQLFGEAAPIGRMLMLDNVEYEVIGVISGGHRIGETDRFIGYIPITTACRYTFQPDTIEITSAQNNNTILGIAFQTALANWQQNGNCYIYAKEKLRAIMPVCLTSTMFTIHLLQIIKKRLNQKTKKEIEKIQKMLEDQYLISILPSIIGRGILLCMGYMIILIFAFSIAYAANMILSTFSEWIPERIVELSSIKSWFWNTMERQATFIHCASRESCQLEFAKGLIQWGSMVLWIGLYFKKRIKE